jgi:hypothetical protein
MGMSGFTENRTSGTPDHAGAPPRLLTWQASKAMLPLVGRVAQDIVTHTDDLLALKSELASLDARQRQLSWPERSRRYDLAEKVTIAESDLKKAITELDSLGVALLDARTGLVGFPTMVNQRRAFFNWAPGEDDLSFWSYSGETTRRPVPEDWIANPPSRIIRERPSRRSR